MIDHPARVYICQGFKRHLVPIFLLVDPCRQSLLHDPPSRTFNASNRGIDLIGRSTGTWAVKTPVPVAIFITPNRHESCSKGAWLGKQMQQPWPGSAALVPVP
ncbi:hypothetical protein [Sphingobium fuliginis]|uniref:hypothetical protein n=1 Tax=Sphingobium fuliginis (strain ATCC 27551) TaxID=336203 RepID=UPI0037C5EE19